MGRLKQIGYLVGLNLLVPFIWLVGLIGLFIDYWYEAITGLIILEKDIWEESKKYLR